MSHFCCELQYLKMKCRLTLITDFFHYYCNAAGDNYCLPSSPEGPSFNPFHVQARGIDSLHGLMRIYAYCSPRLAPAKTSNGGYYLWLCSLSVTVRKHQKRTEVVVVFVVYHSGSFLFWEASLIQQQDAGLVIRLATVCFTTNNNNVTYTPTWLS